MIAVLTLLFGFVSGYFFNVLAIKISFKHRTIENKIKIYDSLIIKWVEMRNCIIHFEREKGQNFSNTKWIELDKIYSQTQTFIGEAFLISDDQKLVEDINNFNEKYCRANWSKLPDLSASLQDFKEEGIKIVSRMKADIQDSTRFVWRDLSHLFKGFFKF
ncbi:hypothetical protein [Legionella sp.]|uniref:hypothetical protein n=1 Tax=Legionella sp. TaxID=459 RepID=UPI00321F880F